MHEWLVDPTFLPADLDAGAAANDAAYPVYESLEATDLDDRVAVLVIEDNDLLGLFVQTVLERRGLAVTRVTDHHMALPYLSHRRFDVVVADVHTPDGSLDRLAAVLDCLEHRPKLVVTSGLDATRLRRIARTYRGTELPKPFSTQELERALLA